MPARKGYWEPLQDRIQTPWQGFLQFPSFFWWIPLTDSSMHTVEVVGVALSALVCLTGRSTWLWQALLWMLYFSIVTTANGTSFYSYGWESQLLETGFLSIFLCAFPGLEEANGTFSMGIWPSRPPVPSPTVRWLYRWLIFRITLGAGLIKFRGSSCWTEKSCLYYHFETQPLPSPLSFVFHFLPPWLHERMIDTDFLVQVYTSWFVFVPHIRRWGRRIPRAGGVLQIGLMVGMPWSGSLAFLHLALLHI